MCAGRSRARRPLPERLLDAVRRRGPRWGCSRIRQLGTVGRSTSGVRCKYQTVRVGRSGARRGISELRAWCVGGSTVLGMVFPGSTWNSMELGVWSTVGAFRESPPPRWSPCTSRSRRRVGERPWITKLLLLRSPSGRSLGTTWRRRPLGWEEHRSARKSVPVPGARRTGALGMSGGSPSLLRGIPPLGRGFLRSSSMPGSAAESSEVSRDLGARSEEGLTVDPQLPCMGKSRGEQ